VTDRHLTTTRHVEYRGGKCECLDEMRRSISVGVTLLVTDALMTVQTATFKEMTFEKEQQLSDEQ
jgi:hypothetical protein